MASLAILAAGWVMFLAYAYPGYMSTDSVKQLRQARSGVYNDWLPPLMSWIWATLELLITGPLGMLILQSLLFLGGAWLLLRRIAGRIPSALLAVVVLLFPAVMTTMAVIWKDSQMAAFLMMGTALLLSSNRFARAGGLLCLFVACGVRYNAAAAILPLLLYVVWPWPRPAWQRIGLAWALTFALFFVANRVNTWLTDEPRYTWHVSLALFDLGGTIANETPASDAEILQRLDGVPLAVRDNLHEKVRASYHPRTWWPLSHGEKRIFDPATTGEHRDAIARAWRQGVLRAPLAYLQHRAEVFFQFLGLDHSVHLWAPVYHGLADSPASLRELGLHARTSETQKVLYGVLDKYQNSPMFRPYVYFFVSILALLVCVLQRRGYEAAFLASGLCYELGFFFVAPSAENRYSHWMFCCVTIAAAIALSGAWAHRRGSSGKGLPALPG